MADPEITSHEPGPLEEITALRADLRGEIEMSRDLAREAYLGAKRRILELEHDLAALATLLGQSLGEPFRSKAAEIVSTRQIDAEED